MFSTVCHFLTAFICISMVTCLFAQYAEIPLAVNHPDVQCFFVDRRGACSNLNWENGEIDCDHLQCATLFARRRKIYIAKDIGRAHNGTRCGLNSVCFLGSCRELPSHISMPKQIGKLPDNYECRKPIKGRPIVAVTSTERS